MLVAWLLLAVMSAMTSALKEVMNMGSTGGDTDHSAEKRHVSLVRSLDSAAASVNASVVVLAGGPLGHW